MLTPREEACLRDRMTVELCEATSPLAVLVRLRAEERERRPVYDPCPDLVTGRADAIQPRDLVLACASCGDRFVARHTAATYCSDRCRQRAYSQPARALLRQRYPAGQAS